MAECLPDKSGMSFNAESLYAIARRAVNNNILSRLYIDDLEIPKTVKEDVRNNYIRDNTNIGSKFHSSSIIQYGNNVRFNTHFLYIAPDIFVLYQTWRPEYGNGDFAFEHNIVHFKWYEFDSVIEARRLCNSCSFVEAQERNLLRTKYHAFEPFHGSDIVYECLQEPENWCARCKFTTLFKLIDHEEVPYPWRRYIRDHYNSSDSE